MKTNNPDTALEINESEVRIVVKDQRLLDLWKNELSGQVSDGAWEYDSRTDWLWADATIELGQINAVFVDPRKRVGRKWFKFYERLADVVGDRMIEDAGLKDERELKSLLHIWTNMIRFPKHISELSTLV